MSYVDFAMLRYGSKIIQVNGTPNTEVRKSMIDEAITLLQSETAKRALSDAFLGIKNYAGFGDQRCDCPYGFGPSHGHIVYSIGRTEKYRKAELTNPERKAAIYYLLAEREYCGEIVGERENQNYQNLWLAIENMDKAEQLFQKIKSSLKKEESEHMSLVRSMNVQ